MSGSGEPFEGSSAAVLRAAAQSLEMIARQIEELGTDLGADAEIATRHIGSLKSFDRWSQHLVQIAQVIAADDLVDAADKVTLADRRDTLREAA